MANANPSQELTVSARDVLFECPACHKSLAIDEAATGMMIECPQCQTNVIVPSRLSENERLVLAAASGDGEGVTYALAHGADVYVEDLDGNNPLALAKQAGHIHIMRLLWQAGAK